MNTADNIELPAAKQYPLAALINQGEDCFQQLTAAERELGAFVLAVERLYGSAAATLAAEHWMELAERPVRAESGDCRSWRRITIQAAHSAARQFRTAT